MHERVEYSRCKVIIRDVLAARIQCMAENHVAMIATMYLAKTWSVPITIIHRLTLRGVEVGVDGIGHVTAKYS